jgi:MSHA biogenesis protein MshO
MAALPNSVRVSGPYVEFLLVRTGGRYRADTGSTGPKTCDDGQAATNTPANDPLIFTGADSCFRSIGDIPNYDTITVSPSANKGDFLVVFNLPEGTPNADAYQFPGLGGNKTRVLGKFPTQDGIIFSSHTFTYESPGNRFFIVEGPVSYSCAGGTLTRYWGYGITKPGRATVRAAAARCSPLASPAREFLYESSIAAQGEGLVTMRLQLSMQDSRGSTETISLYHAVHVNNVP